MATTTRKRTPSNTGRTTGAAPKTTRKASPKHGSNGRFVSKKSHAKRNVALGTAAVAGAAIAGALFAAWRSNAFADLFERDLITGENEVREARDVIDDGDREQFAPATVPLRDSKYDRELAN